MLVDNIIAILSARKGFDGWWNNIDDDIQEEIIDEIVALINKVRI